MEVHITFTGLCLFVEDPNGQHVHVLLPTSSGQHGHEPQVYWPGMESKPSAFSRYSLDLTGLRQGGVRQQLPNVLDVEAMVGGKVPVDAMGRDTGQKVAVRVTLPLADSVSPGPMAVWEIEMKTGQVSHVLLTHQLTWKILNGNLSSTSWMRNALSGGGSGSELLDPPIPDPDGVVRLYVAHLADHHHDVRPGQPAPHPHLFYDVSGHSGKPPVLEKVTARLQMHMVPQPQRAGSNRSETAYNCMLGKSG